MSVINFTKESCKNNKDIINTTLAENFEEHFAMYSLSHIKNLPNIEVANNGEICYFIKCKKDEALDIINVLSSFQCSHFDNTLIPIFNMVKDGLNVGFKVKESD